MDLQTIGSIAPIVTATTALIPVMLKIRDSSKKEHANGELLDYISFKISSKQLPNESQLREMKTLIAYKYNIEPATLYPLNQALKLALISCLKNISEPIETRMQTEKFYYSNPETFANISDEAMLPKKLITHLEEMFKLYLIIFISLYLILFIIIYNDETLNGLNLPFDIISYSAMHAPAGMVISYLLIFSIEYFDKKYQFREKNRKTLKKYCLSIVNHIKKYIKSDS